MVNTKKKESDKETTLFHQDAFLSLSENMTYIKKKLQYTSDLCIQEMCICEAHMMICYIETTSDYKTIQNTILTPLSKETPLPILLETIHAQKTKNLNKAVDMLLRGHTMIYVEGEKTLYMSHTAISFHRSPDEPQNEKVIRGSHEGFIEDMQANLSLIRKKIVNCKLKIKYMTLGKNTQTKIALTYMEDFVNPMLLKQIEKKIESIPSTMISGPGHVEALIETQPWSLFPQVLYTERPDRVLAHVMEGKIALLIDGSADVLILPITFLAFFQTPDDFNSRIWAASFLRLLRFLSFFIAILLPALYIAVISYHFEIIPNEIILLVKSSVEGIPFSPLNEAIIMALTIELIREAGIRLPTPIGQTIGIIGGLIIGDAVVRAGFVSNTMLIVIAVTTIASFTIPSYEMSTTVRLLTFPLMIAATCLGLAGIAFGMMFILAHLCKLESFGTPYFMPFAPLNLAGLKDSIVRFPIWSIDQRIKHAENEKYVDTDTTKTEE
ncbi:spore germination protein [Bacillus thuringiensis]|uniref:spore germination protein n=1 Tax=Bacillus thuringiensis TaxID=1428 RepID=UPI003CFFA7C7